jgi:hypothetical protein
MPPEPSFSGNRYRPPMSRPLPALPEPGALDVSGTSDACGMSAALDASGLLGSTTASGATTGSGATDDGTVGAGCPDCDCPDNDCPDGSGRRAGAGPGSVGDRGGAARCGGTGGCRP